MNPGNIRLFCKIRGFLAANNTAVPDPVDHHVCIMEMYCSFVGTQCTFTETLGSFGGLLSSPSGISGSLAGRQHFADTYIKENIVLFCRTTGRVCFFEIQDSVANEYGSFVLWGGYDEWPLKIKGLFCRIWSLLWGSFAK